MKKTIPENWHKIMCAGVFSKTLFPVPVATKESQ